MLPTKRGQTHSKVNKKGPRTLVQLHGCNSVVAGDSSVSSWSFLLSLSRHPVAFGQKIEPYVKRKGTAPPQGCSVLPQVPLLRGIVARNCSTRRTGFRRTAPVDAETGPPDCGKGPATVPCLVPQSTRGDGGGDGGGWARNRWAFWRLQMAEVGV